MTWTRRQLLGGLVGGGLGAALGLLPGRARADGLAATARVVFFYLPNGMPLADWVPAEAGAFVGALPPILSPLEPWRERLLVLSGLDNQTPDGLSNLHAGLASSALTGERMYEGELRGPDGARSVDQLLAQALPSLRGTQPLVASSEGAQACPPFVGWTDRECLLQNHVSWLGWDTPAPVELSIQGLHRTLFGADDPARAPRLRRALDAVHAESLRIRPALGEAHRDAVDAFSSSLHALESSLDGAACPTEAPRPEVSSAELDVEAHADQLLHLAALGLHCDAHRVVTYAIGREFTRRHLPLPDVPLSHHACSHHGGDPERIGWWSRIGRWEMEILARFVGRLDAMPVPEGGTLLDHTLVVALGGMSDGQTHDGRSVPVALLGGQALGFAGGRHVPFGRRSLADLHLTLLQRLGPPRDTFGAEGQAALPLS